VLLLDGMGRRGVSCSSSRTDPIPGNDSLSCAVEDDQGGTPSSAERRTARFISRYSLVPTNIPHGELGTQGKKQTGPSQET
jgi:hypothetical protein